MNDYWRALPARTKTGRLVARNILSKDGREYRVEAMRAVMMARTGQGEAVPLRENLSVTLSLHPPLSIQNRAWDIDNRIKPILDALTHARVIEDDKHVDELLVGRGSSLKVRPNGTVFVVVRAMDSSSAAEAEEAA
jgi:Holliday junction resolvase RusA-like endonuclease